MLWTCDTDALERLIDANDLHAVMEAIAEICGGKAEHLRENWQDELAAVEWEKDAAVIEKTRELLYH